MVQEIDVSKRTFKTTLDWYYIEHQPTPVSKCDENKSRCSPNTIKKKSVDEPQFVTKRTIEQKYAKNANRLGSEYPHKQLRMPSMEDKSSIFQLTTLPPMDLMSVHIPKCDVSVPLPEEKKGFFKRTTSLPIRTSSYSPMNKEFHVACRDKTRSFKRTTSPPMKTGVPMKLLRILQRAM
mmetsp:Transcript_15267/g.23234  ORF Transcript_15267/g.23234 Transcript_15267/m.23234 type:complete len:179 (-) Transcript_15267:52-588(-)